MIRSIVSVRPRRLRSVTGRVSPPAECLTEADYCLRERLISGLGPEEGADELSELTGNQYSVLSPPGFLAVRTGASVRSRSSSGFSNACWTDHDGTRLTWFAVGLAPAAIAGVTVDFADPVDDTSNAQRCRIAVQYLQMWLEAAE